MRVNLRFLLICAGVMIFNSSQPATAGLLIAPTLRPAQLSQHQVPKSLKPKNQTDRVVEITPQQLIDLQLKKMSPTQRKEAIWAYARNQTFIDSPELWAMPEPLVILAAVIERREPYTPVMLDALERSLPRLPSERSQLQASAILYRYHRPIGENYLRTKLEENGNARIATIFALNKEIALLPQILKAARDHPDDSMTAISALSQWQIPAVTHGLYANFQADPENCNYAVALARQNAVQARPLIQKLYTEVPAAAPAKAVAAVALIKLHEEREIQLLAFLSRVIKNDKVDGALKVATIQSLGDAQETRGIPLLTWVIDNYLAQRGEDEAIPTPVGKRQLAVSAAEALAQLSAPAGRGIIARLLLDLGHIKAEPKLSIRTARALLFIHGSRDAVRNVLGAQWMQQELASSDLQPTLRPLPDELMPPNNSMLP